MNRRDSGLITKYQKICGGFQIWYEESTKQLRRNERPRILFDDLLDIIVKVDQRENAVLTRDLMTVVKSDSDHWDELVSIPQMTVLEGNCERVRQSAFQVW